MPERAEQSLSPRSLLIAAFAAIYLLWGSAYLAIRFAIETMPPLLMAGLRFLIAGGFLYAFTRLRGAPRPTATNWRAAAVVGGLLLGANGAVTWAEQWVPSGLAALLIATVPLWMVLLSWLRGGDRPSLAIAFGLLLGLAGIGLLVGPSNLLGGTRIDPFGALALLLGALSWAAGSLYSRHAPLPKTALLGTGMEMLFGGAALFSAGLFRGEKLQLSAISRCSGLAFGFLVVFGSIVAFSAYFWLLRVTSPARASTYAYVNPVVAVFLGWAFAGEPVTGLTLFASALIVTAVAVIVMQQSRAPKPAAITSPAPEAPPATAPNARSGDASRT